MGSVVKNGGRVMKNVTGYDLVKLFAGSFGHLGVLSEVSLKVLPCPETEATLVLHGLDDGAAVGAMAQAMGSPFEVNGAVHDPAAQATYLRVEGFEASIRYRMDQLKMLLAVGEISELAAAPSAQMWIGLRDVAPLAGADGDVWRVSCKPSDGPALAAASGAHAWYYDWAGGLIWLLSAPGHGLRASLGVFQGHATLVRASEATKTALGVFQPEAPGVARITNGLRARFDPKGLFSPRIAVAAQ